MPDSRSRLRKGISIQPLLLCPGAVAGNGLAVDIYGPGDSPVALALAQAAHHLSDVHCGCSPSGHLFSSSCRMWKKEYARGEGIAPARRWSPLAEKEWTILGERAWTPLGENTWPSLGENAWTSIGRKMTPAMAIKSKGDHRRFSIFSSPITSGYLAKTEAAPALSACARGIKGYPHLALYPDPSRLLWSRSPISKKGSTSRVANNASRNFQQTPKVGAACHRATKLPTRRARGVNTHTATFALTILLRYSMIPTTAIGIAVATHQMIPLSSSMRMPSLGSDLDI